jgi:hypothetical protein
VPVAQDVMWERFGRQEQEFHGLGDDPAAFPEIESGYSVETAKAEAARCYRCDAETGATDYSVHHREDIFSMARTNSFDFAKQRAMLNKRLAPREDPFPEGRPATLDDLTFLPANLSRLVIDPYREACEIGTRLGGSLELTQPFFATGFDEAPDAVRAGVARGLAESGCGFVGLGPIGDSVPWLQLVTPDGDAPSPDAVAHFHVLGHAFRPVAPTRLRENQVQGLVVSSPALLEEAINHALAGDFDAMLLDGSGLLGSAWPELSGAPDLTILREAIRILRRLNREEEIDLIYFGGARSGTDAAKIIALGCVAVVYGVPVGLAAGGEIGTEGMRFSADITDEDRRLGVVNILKASASEASMMARCTGKTNLHNLEPEDLRALTLATAEATGIPLAGAR